MFKVSLRGAEGPVAYQMSYWTWCDSVPPPKTLQGNKVKEERFDTSMTHSGNPPHGMSEVTFCAGSGVIVLKHEHQKHGNRRAPIDPVLIWRNLLHTNSGKSRLFTLMKNVLLLFHIMNVNAIKQVLVPVIKPKHSSGQYAGSWRCWLKAACAL